MTRRVEPGMLVPRLRTRCLSLAVMCAIVLAWALYGAAFAAGGAGGIDPWGAEGWMPPLLHNVPSVTFAFAVAMPSVKDVAGRVGRIRDSVATGRA